jgi:hypothetical protein
VQTKKTESAAIAQAVKKPTYVDIASGEAKQVTEKIIKPWTLI